MSEIPSRRKKPSIIRQRYLAWYQRKYRLWMVIGAALACIVVVLSITRKLFNLNEPLDDLTWLAVFVILFGSISSIVSIVIRIRKTATEIANTSNSVHPRPSNEVESFLERIALPEELENSGYEIVKGGFGKGIIGGHLYQAASVTSKGVNRVLWNRSTNPNSLLRVSVPSARQLKIFGYYKDWARPRITPAIFSALMNDLDLSPGKLANEKKIRLSEDLLLPLEQRELLVERTDYISDLVTGQVTSLIVRDSNRHVIYNGYTLAYDWENDKWKLKLCSESDCSNQIGVSALALGVSRRQGAASHVLQGHVFIVGQAAGNIQSAGLFAPSGSGSLDWSDYTEFGNRFIEGGMKREMLEETWAGTWKHLTARGQIHTVVTGFGRMLHRGGKPEFYGLVVMPRGASEVGIDKTERAYVENFIPIEVFPLSANTLRVTLEDFACENQDRMSHPLYLCINLLLQYLAEQPNRFDNIIKDVGKNAR